MSGFNDLSTITNWSPNSKHVDQFIAEGVSTSSSDILMAVGPPRMTEVVQGPGTILNETTQKVRELLSDRNAKDAFLDRGPANVKAVGAVGSATITQNRPTKVVYEIGSKLQYNVPTNTSGSISLSRVFLNGSSLMKALYSFKTAEQLKALGADDHPGQLNGELWINMASSLFDQPIGIMFWMKNNQKQNVGAYYFENCNVQGLSFALYAAGGVFSEGTQIIFDRVRPIDLKQGT